VALNTLGVPAGSGSTTGGRRKAWQSLTTEEEMQQVVQTQVCSLEARRNEIAVILALGVIRLNYRAALQQDADANCDPGKVRNSGQDCLELPDKTVLSVHTG
jgi:hypothetical protein